MTFTISGVHCKLFATKAVDGASETLRGHSVIFYKNCKSWLIEQWNIAVCRDVFGLRKQIFPDFRSLRVHIHSKTFSEIIINTYPNKYRLKSAINWLNKQMTHDFLGKQCL